MSPAPNNSHVIGLGRSGIAAARLLRQDGWQVTLSDRSPAPPLVEAIAELKQAGITVKLGHTFAVEAELNLLVISPGVPWDAPPVKAAQAAGIETIGEMELAWRYLEDRPWVGITGTNGKTTTTALTAAIFQAAELTAPACGNIGYAACELALTETVPDWVIAEVSSYQIEAAPTLAPKIGLWTTFTPDHLSRHKTLEKYFDIKASLLHRSELAVFNGDDSYLRRHIAPDWPNAHWTSINGKDAIAPHQPTAWIDNGWVTFRGRPIVEASTLKMVGEHNQQNLLLAVTAACLAGIDKSAIALAVADFPGVPHRLEQVGHYGSMTLINDSKATNYEAAAVALAAVESPVILIAGGDPKEGNDQAWLQAIHAKVQQVLLIGKAAQGFAQRLSDTDYHSYEIVDTLERAVQRGIEMGAQYQAKVLLLSPACASFDQYASFEHRGEHFKRLCSEIARKD
ncbi:MAG: UDP-N-acetylmuramoyl-L-alanine--D-glutamate ligase [Cyanobacteria bacterium P01_D01_bin.128]